MLDRMAAVLSALREADQYRGLTTSSGIPLGSNDYLGLATHPRLKQAIQHAVEEDLRVASTGSRLLSGNHERWEQLESEFASWVEAEEAVYFPSGYAANIGLLSSVLTRDDTVFSDAANHASLIDGIRLSRAKRVVFPHGDLNFLEDALRRDSSTGQRVIVVESIFSMEGDHAPLADLVALCETFDSYLIVDEAHSTAVEGIAGRGPIHVLVRSERVLATVHPCGKALASMGAFIAGSKTLREFLINHSRTFIFSTALPPYCAAHVSEALSLARRAHKERTHLHQLSEYLRRGLRAAGFDTGRSDSQIVPVILGTNDAAIRFAAALSEAGFAVRPIRPPTVPAGSSRLRLSLNASLSMENLDTVLNTLRAVRESEAVSK
jgi:8-amino-7-oxononanoate synthase